MIALPCACPFCRALIADDRPAAHYMPEDMPTVAELYRDHEAIGRAVLPEWRRSRRGPVPR